MWPASPPAAAAASLLACILGVGLAGGHGITSIIVAVTASATRVVLADDDVLLREGLAGLLQSSGFEVVGQCGNASDLIELVRARRPDLAIVDIRMPPSHTSEGLEAARVIREELPQTAILVLSAHVQVEQARDLLASGERSGYLLKSRVTDVGAFVETLEWIVRGDPWSIPCSSRSSSPPAVSKTRSTSCRGASARCSR